MKESLKLRSRAGQALLRYWQQKAGTRAFPGRSDINPADIIPLLPNIYMIDVTYDPLDFRYRLIGTGIVDRSMSDYTGQRLEDIPPQRKPSTIWDLLEETVRTGAPNVATVPYLNIPSSFVEKLALPLSDDGITINIIIGSITFEDEYYPNPEIAAM